MEVNEIEKEQSPLRIQCTDTYEKHKFGIKGSEGNIYTNSYSDTSSHLFGIYRLFIRWGGSVYRLVWKEMVLFLVSYLFVSFIYKVVLVNFPVHKQHFELMCIYAYRFSSAIPISFLIGFYVSSVLSRWWDQFMSLPYPDQLALKLVAFVPGNVSVIYDFQSI